MERVISDKIKIPVFLIHSTSVSAFNIFNANEWNGSSKAIVSSCASQFGLLNYSAMKLTELFKISNDLCQPKFNDLEKQWKAANWDIENCYYLAEVPEIHLFIQVYLNSVKSFLDLIVQLISTEKIVYKKIHGFHKKKKDPGGEVLHTLKNKSTDTAVAKYFIKLFLDHKRRWIDDAIIARDLLVHPHKGLLQVMFQLKISAKYSEEIDLVEIIKPSLNGVEFDKYAVETFKYITEFSSSFISALKSS